MTYHHYEFFAGGGMASVGLGANWNCLFANDFDERKSAAYRDNHENHTVLRVEDINLLSIRDLPSIADLAWASFPCQDLSLAGNGAGLQGKRSGTFWAFRDLISDLDLDGRAPTSIVLENVYGAITSNRGRDFFEICGALAKLRYRFGAVVINAVDFVPQSRPRLFIIGIRSDKQIPPHYSISNPNPHWHPETLVQAFKALPIDIAANWSWWNLPIPPKRNVSLSTLIEDKPKGVHWHTEIETQYLLNLMSEYNYQKVEAAKKIGRRIVGTVYRRTRPDKNGVKRQRAEVRFDDVAGCLRTPTGGSSRQTILVVNGDEVRSRLLSPREAARLMGLPDEYKLPERYNDAYHLMGDGVVAPVVRHIAEHLLEPILASNKQFIAA